MTEVDRQTDANAIADRFWDRLLDLSPISATLYGYPTGADRLDDPGPAGRAAARELYTATLADVHAARSRAGAVAADAALSTEDAITLDILEVICEIGLEQQDQRVDRLGVVDQAAGPQTILPQLAAFQPTDTPERFDALIARLEAYPAFMEANAGLVREGLDSGLTAARTIAERVVAQLERLLAIPVEESPIAQVVKAPSARDRDRLLEAIRRSVHEGDRLFLAALRGPYLEAARTEPGLWSAPDGEALYRTQIRAWTTLDLEPRAIHEFGLQEFESIETEKREIARSLGYGDDVAAARAALRSEPDSIPASIEELVDHARGQIARALAAAPRYFGRLPVSAIEVRPVEPFKEADAPPAYYFAPAQDGSRPGIYYVNTYDLPSRNYMGLASTSFHEAVPGHHFQIALELEHPELNAFRRLGSRMAGTSYTEGWGLYSERLADEMGLYQNEAERLGMLDGQSWRAARLVVDTGLHALRWTREQSIDLLERAGLSRTDAVIETDRYIAWPGQALTYKLGQREIERLRRELAERLGPEFDLRAFHDAVLGHGTLPLVTLAKELPGWLGVTS